MNAYSWQRWFAWYPVRVFVLKGLGDHSDLYDVVWFKWVERRHVGAVAPNGDLTDYWEYRRL